MAEYIERERSIQKVKNVIATEWFRGNYEAIGPLQRVVDVQICTFIQGKAGKEG